MEKAKIARPNSFRDVLLRVVLRDGAMIYLLIVSSKLFCCFIAYSVADFCEREDNENRFSKQQ